MEEKVYTCECGKVFVNYVSCNSHKQSCEAHILNKYGSWEAYNKIRFRNHEHIGELNHQNSLKRKQQELEKWISEQHTCEKCGKVMTEKFGSGRFCCKACANSHKQTEEQNKKRSQAIKSSNNYTSQKEKQLQLIKIYNSNPNKCCICGEALNYKHRKHKTCSLNCKNILLSQKAKENGLGGITKGHGTGKGGYYKGIRCDSKYELIYLLYCLHKGLNIIRNKKYFYYVGPDNKRHRYYPDFYIVDTDTFVELKGYFQENTSYKLEAVSKLDINYQILYWEDIKPMLSFIKEKFGLSYETIDKLYDNNKE